MKNKFKLLLCTLFLSVIHIVCYSQNAQIGLKESYYFERYPFELRTESPYNMIEPKYIKNSDDLVFDIEIKNPEGEFFRFYSSMVLFLKPGARLELDYNGRNYFNSKFSGDLSAENQWLNSVLVNKYFKNKINIRDFEPNFDGYKRYLKSIDIETKKLQTELRSISSDSYFIKECLSRIDFIVATEYFDAIDMVVEIQQNMGKDSKEYLQWKKEYIDDVLPLALKRATKQLSKYKEEEIIANYHGCKALGVIANRDKDFLSKRGYHKFNEIYKYSMATIDQSFMFSPEFLEYVKEIKDSVVLEHANRFIADNKHLFRNVVSPDFEFTDIDGKIRKLSEFKGSVIYIDVWATWCNPCKAISPIFNQLVDDMKDSGVKFLAVSIDSKIDAWKSYIEKNPHSENMNEFFANGKNFTDYYNISSIPRFMVIDKEFKIRFAYAQKPFSHTLELVKEMLHKVNNE